MLLPESVIPAFTIVHVAISLAAIGAGVVVLGGMAADKRFGGWTAAFLATTAATSVTGFGFPIQGVTPGIVFGVLSLLALAAAGYARYVRHLAGVWQPVYVIGAAFALYLNLIVLIVQAFQKLPLLRAAAPTQAEAPFVAAQVGTLAAVVAAAVLSVRRFRVRSGAE